MILFSKISRLAKIPLLLQKKRDSKKSSKKKGEDAEKRPPFPLKNKPAPKKPKAAIPDRSAAPSHDSPKTARKEIGRRIDITV